MIIWKIILVEALLSFTSVVFGCQFFPPGEYLRFVRVPENLQVGKEVLKIDVFPRRNLNLQPVDKNDDVHYFTYRDLNRTTVSLLLARSLDDLVDTDNPQNVLKFKLVCDYDDGEDTITSSLSVTVYVEDINDNSPIFTGTPYEVTVDELTPSGLTIFRGIRATDRDKPNTPNSDVQYAITAGNERGKFALDSSHQAFLVLKKALDYDSGDREFTLTVTASDRGLPPRITNETVKVTVKDADDLPPKFTKGVYRTKISEFYPLTGRRIHHRLDFDPSIYAFDQDVAIDTAIRYDILAGNERHLFYLDHVNGSLFLEREIDLDSERSLPGNTFVLQIQASQIDNPLKTGVARVEIEVIDLNDNLPEFEVDFYNISIVENLPNGFSVLQILATDPDQGDNGEFTYQLDDNSGSFNLDSRTGWLTVKNHSVLDRETRSTILMRVNAREKTKSVVTNKIAVSSVNVEVTLLDANDNNPTFIPNNVYEFVTLTSSKIGTIVGQVHAIDPDLGRNGLVSYAIEKSTNNSTPFKIDSITGQIFIAKNISLGGQFTLLVEASDQPENPSERRFSLAVVTIDVKQNGPRDSNKEIPEFIGAPYEFWVGGNAEIGTSVGQVRVTDNIDKKQIVYDLLHSYHEGVPFAIEERSGTITIVDDLDKYYRSIYDFEAVVTNEKDISIVANVTIHVVDPQDGTHKLLVKNGDTSPIEFHIKENLAETLIGKLMYQNTTSGTLRFSIANQHDISNDIIITSNGSLYTQKPLDREIRDTYRLTIIAEYTRGVIAGTGVYQVTVYVDDENDNAPEFERKFYEGKIPENCKSGTEVDLLYPVKAVDGDIGINGQFTITMFGEGSEIFRLDKATGKMYFNSASSPIDREETASYNIKLIAKDEGGLFSEAKLTIFVEDINDNPPLFTQMIILPDKGVEVLEYDKSRSPIQLFQEQSTNISGVYTLTQSQIRTTGKPRNKMSPLLSVPEDIGIGIPILRLIAEDKDLGDNSIIKYDMSSETYIPNEISTSDPYHVTHFMVHPTSGEISVARALPPESEFRLNVSASDKGGLRDNITIRISVKDVNDHAPIFQKQWYNFDTEESSYVRKFLGKIEASDADFGHNANVSYQIQEDDDLPFLISEFSGILSVNGELDREIKDKYSFAVIASDNPLNGKRLSSTVNVEVNILDINDNAPEFYGYDDVIKNVKDDSTPISNHNFPESNDIAIYYASAAENIPIGTPVTRVFANDSDFTGNGNGLLLFTMPQKKNKENLFTIDSKEGIIITTGKLDYEKQKSYNLTVVASDLGSPSLSSTALVIVNVIDVPEDMQSAEEPIFLHRYYEVEVEENVPVPLKLLTLNVTDAYKGHRLKYTIVGDKFSDIKRMFRIDPRNGTLYITESPDRESKSFYEVRIRLDEYKVTRDMTVMVYPVTNERLGDLKLNEVKVIIRITDVNDNVPKFTVTGRPIIAAIPSSASYGYSVVRVKAKDPDLGLNGEVRYQILGRNNEDTRRFAIDSITGQVRAIAGFTKDAGKVFGFDVKAMDRRGADDGKSSIANIFVYILDEKKQLIMVMGSKPTDIEKSMTNITTILFNVTGYDIRVRKLEPHSDKNRLDNSATDMYLYGVDPALNVVIESDKLQRLLNNKQHELEKHLEPYKMLAFASGVPERKYRNQMVLLSTLELGVVILGCVVFIGALVTALCVVCVRRRRRRKLLRKSFALAQPAGYTLAAATSASLGKPHLRTHLGLYPVAYGDGQRRYVSTPSGYPPRHVSRQHKSRRKSRERSRSVHATPNGVETSITSLHSSGRDSGIVDGGGLHCPCGQSSGHSSDTSTNSSYEDSLNSMRRKNASRARSRSLNRSEGLSLPMSMQLSRYQPPGHLNPAAYLIPPPVPSFHRSHEQLFGNP